MKSRFFLAFLIVLCIFSFASAQQEEQPKAGEVKLTLVEELISIEATNIKNHALLVAKKHGGTQDLISADDLLMLQKRINQINLAIRMEKESDDFSLTRLGTKPDFIWVLDLERILGVYFDSGLFKFRFTDYKGVVGFFFAQLTGKPIRGIQPVNRWWRRLLFGLVGGLLLMILAATIVNKFHLYPVSSHFGINLYNIFIRSVIVGAVWLILCLFVLR